MLVKQPKVPEDGAEDRAIQAAEVDKEAFAPGLGRALRRASALDPASLLPSDPQGQLRQTSNSALLSKGCFLCSFEPKQGSVVPGFL